MSNEEMTKDECYKYLRKMKQRYVKAKRQERGRLLDEMEAVTGLRRKSLIRLLKGHLTRQPRRRERGKVYGAEVQAAVNVIAESLDYPCAERLTPVLGWMARHLAAHGELQVSEQVQAKLERVSRSTVERMLPNLRRDRPRVVRKGVRRTQRLVQDIPMKRLAWDEAQAGHLEVDLVHHCGPVPAGEYAHTLQWIDVATGWSERVVILGRSYLVMQDAFCRILARLPFPVVELHPDNGTEFLNAHLLRFCAGLVPSVCLSRSRPFHKNDNPRVEQKNFSLVRAYLGDDRLDSVAQVLRMNQLYDQMWIYHNLFQPVMHLQEKTVLRQPDQSTRIIRRHDQACTPFERLCETLVLWPAHREQLLRLRDQVNPRQLRQDIYDGIEQLFQLPNALPGVTQDVYLTLWQPNARIEHDLALQLSFQRTTPTL